MPPCNFGKRMSFTSIIFLFWFLPLSLILYYLVKDDKKEYLLLAISLFFYACGSIKHFFLFLVSLVINVVLGRLLAKVKEPRSLRTLMLSVGVIFDVLFLGYYKYSDTVFSLLGSLANHETASRNVLLPLGISFFTFKEISYLADAYTGKSILSPKPTHDALYFSFFAQIQSGPIARYTDQKCRPGFDLFAQGAYRFIVGFNKKILLADMLSHITAETFAAEYADMSVGYAWLGAICYSLQLFFDFAGYSDMAIGISQMFGYPCPENFNYPYMTRSVSEFWRRWHITLGAWFRDYIYIPLGGSRVSSRWRRYFNLLIVWILTAVWHGTGWNFAAWGLGYFVLIVFEKETGLPQKLRTPLGRLVYRFFTLLFINFQWVLFRSDSLKAGAGYIRSMFLCRPNALADSRAMFLIKDYSVFLFAAIVLCFPIMPWLEKRCRQHKMSHMMWELVLLLLNSVLFIWSVSFVISGQNNPFAYAGF